MLELTRQPGCPFDTIVVHSLSRFYRSGPEAELLIRDLAKKGVRVQSVSQPIGDDHTQVMLRQIIGVLDEHTSRENGKNVRRAMRENAEQGFWNGTPTPLGYESVEAERRGTKVKKRLTVEPVEAETLHTIFDVYDRGLPGRGALGVKEVANVLNERGYRTRKGARFGVGPVHAILISRYYATGLYPYTVGTGQVSAPDAAKVTVHIPIPKLIDEAQFERVQAKPASRNPNVTPPRVVNGPALLAGMTSCAICAAGLMRTGTTRRGKRYSYYSCAGHQLKGKTECRGCHMPADKLDDAVLGALKERLFAPGRLGEILRVLLDRQKRNDTEVAGRVADLKVAVADAAGRLKRLYRLVEDGAVEVDDVLEDRLRVLRAEKAKAEAARGRAGTRSEAACVIDEAVPERFGQLMRDKLDHGDVNARRAYIASVVSAIEVGHDRIRIVGQRDTLQRLVRQQEGDVPGFLRGWRAPQEGTIQAKSTAYAPQTLLVASLNYQRYFRSSQTSGRRWNAKKSGYGGDNGLFVEARHGATVSDWVARLCVLLLRHCHIGGSAVYHGMQTVLTTSTFDRQARAAGLTDDEVATMASTIGADPTSGDLIPGTGGARKLRFPRPGAGKSGGFRTIHYFGGDDVPVFLLAIVDKGQRANLSKAERNELADVLPRIADAYRAGVARRVVELKGKP